jgi:hypothetical protein
LTNWIMEPGNESWDGGGGTVQNPDAVIVSAELPGRQELGVEIKDVGDAELFNWAVIF